MENIFEKLKRDNICHAVGIAKNTLISCDDDDIGSRDYFVILSWWDKDRVSDIIGFKKTEDLRTIEKSLSENEIKTFYENIEEYKQVINNNYGVIYELKDNCFKENYINENQLL